ERRQAMRMMFRADRLSNTSSNVRGGHAPGKAQGLVNTMLNGLVMAKRAPDLGEVMVPTPVLSTPSVVAVNYGADEVFKSFVSGWAEYNRRIGNNQTWIVDSLEPFGVTLED